MFEIVVIVLNYNTKKITFACLDSLFAANPSKHNVHIVVVDNASTDGSAPHFRKHFAKADIIVNSKNIGFAAGNNIAIKKYTKLAKKVLILNSDTLVEKDIFAKLGKTPKLNNFGIVSLKLVNSDLSLQPTGGNLPTPLYVFLWLSGIDDLVRKLFGVQSYQRRDPKFFVGTKEIGWVGGTAMLVNTKVFSAIGLFDENLFMYGEDVEFCMRAGSAGFKVGWTDVAQVVHLAGASLDKPFYRMWLGELRGLLYIYKKYYGAGASFVLKLFMYPFLALRAVAFYALGKKAHANAYAEILTTL